MRSTKQAKREAKEMFRHSLTDGVLDQDCLRQLARGVAATGYRNRLGILTHLCRLVKIHSTENTAMVQSATPLPPSLQADLEISLTRQYGRKITTTFGLLPELIGGMRIRVGSNVYDGSVQAALTAFGESL